MKLKKWAIVFASISLFASNSMAQLYPKGIRKFWNIRESQISEICKVHEVAKILSDIQSDQDLARLKADNQAVKKATPKAFRDSTRSTPVDMALSCFYDQKKLSENETAPKNQAQGGQATPGQM